MQRKAVIVCVAVMAMWIGAFSARATTIPPAPAATDWSFPVTTVGTVSGPFAQGFRPSKAQFGADDGSCGLREKATLYMSWTPPDANNLGSISTPDSGPFNLAYGQRWELLVGDGCTRGEHQDVAIKFSPQQSGHYAAKVYLWWDFQGQFFWEKIYDVHGDVMATFPAGQPWLQQGPSMPNMIQYVDVNGDGKADALYFDTSRSNGLWVALSNGSGFVSVGMQIQYGTSSPEMLQFADVTGDGLPDALYFDTNNSNQVIVSRNLGNDSAGHWLGFGQQERWLQHGPSTPDMIQYADVNGDGKPDALYFDTSRSNGVWVSLSTGTGFTAPQMWLQHGPSTPAMIQYKDVDGDGKADALYFDTSRSNGVWVSLSTGIGFTAPQMWLQQGPSTPDMIQYADVNGDGKADALYFDTSRSNGVWVSLSTGIGFTTPQMWLQHGPSTPAMVQYKDVNGDGKTDALYFDTSRSHQVWLSLSTGSGFTTPTPFMQEGDSTPDMMQYADVNGDGKADAVYFDTSRSYQVWVLLTK